VQPASSAPVACSTHRLKHWQTAAPTAALGLVSHVSWFTRVVRVTHVVTRCPYQTFR